jgi:hypothetical protein
MSVSSNLQTQPSWLDTFPDEDVAFGFDSTGMWFSGDASDAPYPIRTNYDIGSDETVVVIYTFVHADLDEGCPDHGICFFKADVEPYWSWGDDTSRIAVQYNCGDPEINGQANTIESDYELTLGDTYTARVTYNPVAETITHELFNGNSVGSPLVDTITLTNERLPAGAYRIGFHADLDTSTSEKSYFTYLEISAGAVEAVTRVFRAMHFPNRRREVISATDPTPKNVQPGEMLYDAEENKLYAGLDDTTVAVGVDASSGDITFNGVQIIGAGEDSGDGLNNGTIELVPDSTLYANDQYLIIDPTGPNHIHIRAGGTQDGSSAELILGGEQANVKIVDYNHQVQIQSTANQNGIAALTAITYFAGGYGYECSTMVPAGTQFIIDGTPHFVTSIITNPEIISDYGDGQSPFLLILDPSPGDINSNYPYQITTVYQWNFNNQGNLEIPGGIKFANDVVMLGGIVAMTQEAYDGISPDANTTYLIIG